MVRVPLIEPAVNISLFGGSSMPSIEDKESEYESSSRSPTPKPCKMIIYYTVQTENEAFLHDLFTKHDISFHKIML